MKKVTVVQPETDPIPTEVLATNIRAISAGIKKLRKGRLKDTTLYLLIQHACPYEGRPPTRPTISTVRNVIDALENLEATYLKKEVKP